MKNEAVRVMTGTQHIGRCVVSADDNELLFNGRDEKHEQTSMWGATMRTKDK